uniref:Uncharacterized protein n=1 Tax=Globisporangium ultimum (strain ATCC 200006 / CBS 805.95 / DAOM BR144) TaxID=431595 RepID=K3X7W7_GLOUD
MFRAATANSRRSVGKTIGPRFVMNLLEIVAQNGHVEVVEWPTALFESNSAEAVTVARQHGPAGAGYAEEHGLGRSESRFK